MGHRGFCFDLCSAYIYLSALFTYIYCLLSVLLIFYSKSFIVSGLTFRSLIHFEFIFEYGVRKVSNFILLHVAVQFSQHYLLKRLSLPPLSKIRYP